ncbi:MAG: glutamine-hydrolyzing GMP synthase, partial [Oscillospiraceae bacterium]|nr:glutamine-hydrolyzing GMP synthase [Oscillospiraceae bacterium]
MKQDMILICDLGNDENSALARAIRALGVYSEVHPHDLTASELAALPNVKGIILNKGMANVVPSEAFKLSGLPLIETEGLIPEEELRSFVFDKCGCEANWNMENFIADQIEIVRAQVGDGKVLLALSGGVDSSVVAALLIRAIGDRLTCVHVNHGLLRKGEPEEVVRVFREELGAHLIYVDAIDRFLDKLDGVEEPEAKRKIIGKEFIEVFADEA